MRKRHLPPLNALTSFDMVAKTKHFAKAADLLCITNSAVSQNIKTLEKSLKVELIKRSPHGVTLTEAGEQYAKQIDAAMNIIENATEQLDHSSDAVRVNILHSLSLRWFIPKLTLFNLQHPNIDVRLATLGYEFDFNKDHIDISISYGKPANWPNTTAHLLFETPLIAVCNPKVSRHQPFTILLKSKTPLIITDNPYHQKDWEAYFNACDFEGVDMSNALHYPTTLQTIEAAKAGAGIAIVHKQLVQEELEHGVLVQACPLELSTDEGYYLIEPKHQPLSAKAHTFAKWLLTVERENEQIPH